MDARADDETAEEEEEEKEEEEEDDDSDPQDLAFDNSNEGKVHDDDDDDDDSDNADLVEITDDEYDTDITGDDVTTGVYVCEKCGDDLGSQDELTLHVVADMCESRPM